MWQAYVLGAACLAVGLVTAHFSEPPAKTYRYDQFGVHVVSKRQSVVLEDVEVTLIVAPIAFGLWLVAQATKVRFAARPAACEVEVEEDVVVTGRAPRPLLARPPLVPPPRLPGVIGDPFRDAPAPPPIVPVQPRLARESPLVQGDPADRPKILT